MADEKTTAAYRKIVQREHAKMGEAGHPEDRKNQSEDAVDGLEHGLAFAEEHMAELAACIGIYPDNRAEMMFESLRERFWAMSTEERAKRGRRG